MQRPGLGLTLFLAGTSLALSRLGLLMHELAGHGGMAIAVGGTVTDAHLFWFAGGWIRYVVPGAGTGQELAISLAGIAVETVLGIALWLGLRSRGEGLGGRVARTLGLALIVHAMFYLATGTWHGYGDGRLIHALLGGACYPVAIAAGALGCAAGYTGARYLFASLRAAIPGRRLGPALAAIAAAAAINVALDVGELRLRRDRTYLVAMQPERERIAARELAAWQRAQPAPVSDAERDAQARELAARHRDFPFVWLLGGSLILAIVAGAARSAERPERPLAPRLATVACGIAAISTAAVIAIDAMFH
ncbi:MAG TPA: hypothetical protein VGC42_28635 [Kofleriaceae bacterium]